MRRCDKTQFIDTVSELSQQIVGGECFNMPNIQPSNSEISSDLIDYPARDMTITVGAAMTVGRLREVLLQEKQQLPIDTPHDDLTLGEMVAQDVSGPRQFGYGTLRDYVIGIEAADGSGRVFHAGGRVVKNVAGYDLCRLLIGAQGKLGTLRQVTFKLKPLPVEQHCSVAGFRTLKDLDSALNRINLTSTTPQILDVLNPVAAQVLLPIVDSDLSTQSTNANAAFLLMGFEGSRKACDWQTKTLADELQGTASFVTTVARPDIVENYCRAAMQLSAEARTQEAAWSAKVIVLPSQFVSVLQLANHAGFSAFGRAGNGVLYLKSDSIADLARLREQLVKIVDAGGGSVEIREPNQSWRHPAVASIVERYSNRLHALLG